MRTYKILTLTDTLLHELKQLAESAGVNYVLVGKAFVCQCQVRDTYQLFRNVNLEYNGNAERHFLTNFDKDQLKNSTTHKRSNQYENRNSL